MGGGSRQEVSIDQVLMNPGVYPNRPQIVERVETHISWIFLAGDLAYKVKKPLNFGFLDFSNLAKRERFCREEVLLNRRLAPEVYLGVVPITLEKGKVRVRGRGRIIEYAVEMRRLPQDRMLDRLLDRNLVGTDTIRRICDVLVDFYDHADTGGEIDRYGEVKAICFNTEENYAQTEHYIHVALSDSRFQHIQSFTRTFLTQEDLFRSRITQGKIRDCHGDLHTKNICILDDVIIYDCIEFNRRFRYGDVAADVAFLAMDLDFLGRRDLSDFFIREFALKSNDPDCLKLMDFYKCYRAYVRGKILCFAFDEAWGHPDEQARFLMQAKRYFALAESYTSASRLLRVIVVFGLAGTGKTTLAEALGYRFDIPVLSADRIRKVLANLPPTAREPEDFEQGLYSREMTKNTYAKMAEDARKFLSQGYWVILDASFRNPEDRARLLDLETDANIEVLFVHCTAKEGTVRERLSKRAEDPAALSDARWEIYRRQKVGFQPRAGIPTDRYLEVAGDDDVQQNVTFLEARMQASSVR